MPPVFAAIGAAFAGMTITSIVTKIAISLVISVVFSALAPRPKLPQSKPLSSKLRGRTEMVRQAVVARRTVYGEVMVSGPIIYPEGTGSDNDYLYLVLALAGHECEAIGRCWFDDDEVILDGDEGTGRYDGKAWIYKHLGASDQAADADLVAASDGVWTTEHRGRGICNVVTCMKYSDDVYPQGIPKLRTLLRGVKLYDPRDAGTRWGENPALVLRDYLIRHLEVTTAEIDDTTVIAAANICEEFVDVVEAEETVVADADEDTLALDERMPALRLGDRVWIASDDTLPAGLTASTNYYWIPVDDTTGSVATTYAAALVGTAVDITDAGAGVHTLTRKGEVRYACNGHIQSDTRPEEAIEDILSSMAGTLTFVGGQWKIYAGAAGASTITLTESDLRGPITVKPEVSRTEVFNALKPIHVDPDKDWQATTAPPVNNAAYEAEDNGERIWKNLELSMTLSPSAAQRLGKIDLERGRQQMTATFPAMPEALRLQVWDVVAVTNERFGWSAKDFRIIGMTINPDLSVELSLREEAAAMWTWSAEETTTDLAPNTNLPNAFIVAAPTALVVTSGTAVLDIRQDGTIFSRIKAAWVAPADVFVTNGGRCQVRYKKAADSTWIYQATIPGAITEAYILDVQDGVAYDVEVRAVNSVGVRSDKDATDPWQASVTSHTVAGKSADPSDVTSLTAQQNGSVVTFKWPAVSDLDRDGYEIRYAAQGAFDWDSATVLTEETKGTLVTNAALPPGEWTVGIKAMDTTGNYSAAAATYDIAVVNQNDVVVTQDEHPEWLGTRTNLIKHDVSGRLVPDSQTLADAMTDAQLWDQMVYDPYATCTYEGAEVDLGFDADGVRVWADIAAGLGPGESGVADPILEVDYKDAAGSYDGFEDWTVGALDARYIKARAKIDTATGVAWLGTFDFTADVAERTESGQDVTVAVAGTAITFAQQFHGAPGVQVTADGASAVYPVKQNVTATGFSVTVYDSGGIDVGGTVDWQATGA